METKKIKNFMFSDADAEMFENIIESVHIEADEKIIVIKKR